jgi:hypothetical protein
MFNDIIFVKVDLPELQVCVMVVVSWKNVTVYTYRRHDVTVNLTLQKRILVTFME